MRTERVRNEEMALNLKTEKKYIVWEKAFSQARQ
jgi:hypothetical protein